MTEDSIAQQIMEGERAFQTRIEARTAMPDTITYEDTRFEIGFRADLLMEAKVIIEVKPVSDLAPIHKKQLFTYLKLSDKTVSRKER